MQTFLPFPDFAESARCLDRQRLGKQRVETLQLLRVQAVPRSGWSNHPASRMWRGYERSLAFYGLAVCFEWQARGYKDTCAGKIAAILRGHCEGCGGLQEGDALAWYREVQASLTAELPPWFGDPEFHSSHRRALLCKDFEHYGRFEWPEGRPSSYVYAWPV